MTQHNGSPSQQREQIFETVSEKFGFVPNLIRQLAGSPASAQAYLSGADALSSGELSPREQQVVQTAVAVHNSCHYCTAVHGTMALGAGLAKDDLAAILSGAAPSDDRISAVVHATRLVLERRGWLEQDDLEKLESRGISRSQLFEIIGFIGVKTISNYVNHIAGTEIDDRFKAVTEMPEYQEAVARTRSVPA